ncbi:MAG: alpha-L-fucosidase [Candidatus Egerieousia sp.]
MKNIIVAIALTLSALSPFSSIAQNDTGQPEYTPTEANLKARKEFSDARFGIFIHWGIYSQLGRGEWVMQNENINYKEYPKMAKEFNPVNFDADKWVKAIKASGAKYITITSRHHDGFSMFKSKASKYNIVDATPFKRDPLKELADACAKEGLKLHFYYSHLDWGRTDFWPLGRTGRGTGRPDMTSKDKKGKLWKHYQKFMERQLTELLSNYGNVGAIWFDGVWDMDSKPREAQPEIWGLDQQYRLIHSLQPACLIGNNHHLLPFAGEDIQIFERDIPGKNEYGLSGQEISRLPLETCQTMNRSWGYRSSDNKYKSSDELIRYLVQTAGKGANLLLNIGPKPDGTLPDEALERLEAIGKWMNRFGPTIYGTDEGCIEEQPWGVTTQRSDTLFVHVLKDTSEVLLPLAAHNVLEARTFSDGKEIKFTHSPEGVILHLPKGTFQGPDFIINVRLAQLTEDESDALAFLYKYMPLPDLTGYSFGYWLENVRKTLEVREKSPWRIPDTEFRHFVLPLRVNNETLDDFRILYADKLRDRIKGMDINEAALEINHWCHEMATYAPSDGRTLPPTGTIKGALGRCGEESVLAVAALRAAGIPARQVYTPRWAHTDDNHAWVEVFVDGKWQFMGACEPEPVLNLAWFNAPVSRAMLLHTLAFGDYNGPEDVIRRTHSFTEINVIKSYIPTRRTTVRVLDVKGLPVEGARVEFKIYNYAEFYTVARPLTDSAGYAALDTGLGDLLIWAVKDDMFGVTKASGDRTEVVLDHKIGENFSLDFKINPPVENPIPSKATAEQTERNAARLAQEDSIRMQRPKGNADVLDNFKLRHSDAKADALLKSLSVKDLGDVREDVLEDAYAHIGDVFDKFRDCPRVSIEPLLPYFSEIGNELKAKTALEVKEWILNNIRTDDVSNPQRILIPPVNVWNSRICDNRSREVFFVAACRSIGIHARIDEITGKTQYMDGGDWIDVKWGEELPKSASYGRLKATYKSIEWLRNPLYYRHFTLAKIEDGRAKLLSFDEDNEIGFNELLAKPYEAEEGYYALTSGIRLADGSVNAHIEFFNISKDSTTTVPLVLKSGSDDLAVIGNIDAEKKFLKDGEEGECSILSTTGRGYFAIAVINDFSEPSIHALRQISSLKKELNDWGRSLIVLSGNTGRCSKYLNSIENITYGTDPDGKILKMIYEGCKPKYSRLPVIIIADSFGRVVYFSQGYNTSLAENIKAILPAL